MMFSKDKYTNAFQISTETVYFDTFHGDSSGAKTIKDLEAQIQELKASSTERRRKAEQEERSKVQNRRMFVLNPSRNDLHEASVSVILEEAEACGIPDLPQPGTAVTKTELGMIILSFCLMEHVEDLF